MTDLSPAAQAVKDAAWGSFWSDEAMAPNDAEIIAAAALRAAADQIEDLYCDGDVEDSPGVVFALRQLMLIAAELEGSDD
jgi:hypothetical protein